MVFPPDSCGYTSGSESEVGDDSEGEGGQQRRLRTKFTSEQVGRLEGTFRKHKYLGAVQRRKIAEKLSLSETQVCLWGTVANTFESVWFDLIKSYLTMECFINYLLSGCNEFTNIADNVYEWTTLHLQVLTNYYKHLALRYQ